MYPVEKPQAYLFDIRFNGSSYRFQITQSGHSPYESRFLKILLYFVFWDIPTFCNCFLISYGTGFIFCLRNGAPLGILLMAVASVDLRLIVLQNCIVSSAWTFYKILILMTNRSHSTVLIPWNFTWLCFCR